MIPLCVPQIEGNEWKYIKECLDTNWVSSVGSYVNLFEEKFAAYTGAASAVVTVNGTAAITLALQVLGIGAGDEVIVPSMTFSASVNPIIYVGAEPVFADITADTWVMDVNRLETLITPRTKAIMPVHLYGNVVDMEPVMKMASKYDLYVIEDATEALGSEYRMESGEWRKAGTIGHFGAFSFNGNKLITTGAGGMLVTNDTNLGRRAKYLSNQAKTETGTGEFLHEDIGYNYRMPNLLAAMGVAQLEQIDIYIDKKLANAKIYYEKLKDTSYVVLPTEKENIRHTHWLYCVKIAKPDIFNREVLIDYLKEQGISSRPFFHPLHLMKPYLKYRCGELTETCKVAATGINLPSSVGLKAEEVHKVCEAIGSFFQVDNSNIG